MGSRAAELITDQLDYQPGDTVYIIGTGFAPGETVFLQVINAGSGEGLSGPWGEPWTALADQDGNVLTTWEVCPEECFEAVLHVMALGETSNEFAETFFTDAIFNLRLLALTSPTGSCSRRQLIGGADRWLVEQGGTYTVTIQTVTTGPGSICFSNDPPSIAIRLDATFGTNVFTVDREVGTNLYRGTVVIPTNACGSSFLTYFCQNGISRRVTGQAGTNFVTFNAQRFTNGCQGTATPINCAPVGDPPTIICPSNIVTTTSGQCSAQVFYPAPQASGSPTPVVSCTPASGSIFPVGIRTVVCTATNTVGSAQCTFSIRVIDDDPPTIICNDVCLTTDAGTCTASRSRLTPPPVSDNCPLSGTNIVTLTNNAPATLPIGTTAVTWTVRDAAGNTASCQQQVTVISAVNVTFLSPVVTGTNEVTHGQTLPVKVQLHDCAGAAVLDGLTARINVRGIGPGPTNVFDNVIELASGTGTSGTATSDGIVELRGNHEHFNLQTDNFVDANTLDNPQRFYRVTVTVFSDATGCAVALGSASFILETRQ